MHFIFIIIFLFVQALSLKNDRPTTQGINEYIKANKNALIDEYTSYIKDTIYNDVYISTEDFSKLNDYNKETVGTTIFNQSYSYEIIINNEPKFAGYDLNLMSKSQKRTLTQFDQFVKATIFHELTHVYINQCLLEMRMKNMYVDPEYDNNVHIYPNYEMKFGSEFIQEGICQYVIEKKHEIVEYSNIFIPKTREELIDSSKTFEVKYQYSSYWLKNFLDSKGLKNGIFILLGNRPPSYDEMINSKSFFDNLK